MLPVEQQHDILEWNLTNHAPNDPGLSKILAYRLKAKEFGHLVIGNSPDCREKSLALQHIEEALFWANASIARTHTGDVK